MAFVFVNNVNTTLADAITSSSQTSITLSSSAGLPTLSDGEILTMTLNDVATQTVIEIVWVTAISGAVLTVLRGQEGTTATTWLAGDYIYAAATAAELAAFAGGDVIESITAGTGIGVTAGQNPTISNEGILNVEAGTGLSTTGGQSPTIANTGIISIAVGTELASTGGQNPTISWSPNEHYYGHSGTTSSSGQVTPPTVPYVILGATATVGQPYGTLTKYSVYIDTTNSNYGAGVLVCYVVDDTTGLVAGAGIDVNVVIITNNVPAS